MPSDYRRVTVGACESTTSSDPRDFPGVQDYPHGDGSRPSRASNWESGSQHKNLLFLLALASNGSSELMSWLCTSTRRDPARARVSGMSLRRDVIDLIVQGVPDVCSPPSSRASVEGRRHVHVARRQARPSGSTSPTRARSGLPCVRFSGPAHERPGDNPS